VLVVGADLSAQSEWIRTYEKSQLK